MCCIMLNQTSGTQVHQVIKTLFRRYPTPKKMANANLGELSSMIKSCGLYNRRAVTLVRFSQEYLWKDWSDPKELYGIGQYARDSYSIFIEGRRIKPADKELKKYIKWKYRST